MNTTIKTERAEALEYLRGILRPGDTVTTTVTHVARSGMTRWIRALLVRDGAIQDISWDVARAVGSPVNTRNHEGVERGGCGMDMGFDLVYSLSRRLFPDGFDCLEWQVRADGTLSHVPADSRDPSKGWRRCPSNDHSNRVDPATLIRDGAVRHTGDGGYALNQRWL